MRLHCFHFHRIFPSHSFPCNAGHAKMCFCNFGRVVWQPDAQSHSNLEPRFCFSGTGKKRRSVPGLVGFRKRALRSIQISVKRLHAGMTTREGLCCAALAPNAAPGGLG